MAYKQELAALQTWVKSTVGLNSAKLKEGMPALARPVIVWESPSRGKNRNLSRYRYVVRVIQFGKLNVANVDQAAELQDALISDLEERVGVIPILDAEGETLALLKQAEIEFDQADGLEIPFKITYDATYTRTAPAVAPNATYVGNKITVN